MRLPDPLARFCRDESGSITIESVFMIPIYVMTIVWTVTYYQGFHDASLNVKVTYTIGDILSREDSPITPEYMDSMYELQGVLTGSDEPRTLRVTAVTFRQDVEENEGEYHVIWSEVRGTGAGEHDDNSLSAIADQQLPEMTDGQVTILTETWLQHTPIFNVRRTADPWELYEVITTRPRAPQFCWNDSNDPSAWNADSNVCNL